MPILPENKHRYPPDWKAIRLRILARSRVDILGIGERYACECAGECGHNHDGVGGRCEAIQYDAHPITGSRVVLTIAHLDHTPENCALDNLRAMCQRCHLAYDKDHHRETRRSRKAIGDLFDAH